LGGRFKGEVSATSGNISGTLEVGEDFTITGTSDVKQGIEYSVENEGLNRYGKFFFRPRSFMFVPRDTLTLEDDVQRNVLMYLERARNNSYDRVLYAKGISEFNGRVAISSKNAKDTTAIPGKPSLFVEDGIGFSGELLCEPRVLSLNSSILSDGFHYLNYIEKSGITVDIQSFRDVDDNLGSMMYIVNTTSGVYTIICVTGGFIYGGERKTSVEIGAFSTIMLFKTHSGDVQIAKMS
jgi:hypothetical protein